MEKDAKTTQNTGPVLFANVSRGLGADMDWPHSRSRILYVERRFVSLYQAAADFQP